MERLGRRMLFVAALGIVPVVGWCWQPVTAAPSERSAAQLVCIYDHQTLHTTGGVCRPRANSYPKQVKTRVQRAIYDSALTFGVPYKVLLKIAICESDLNPRASNGTHFGLYQFAPDTFRRAILQMVAMTGVQARTYWSALDSSYTAGFLFATGESRSWSCEKAVSPLPGQ